MFRQLRLWMKIRYLVSLSPFRPFPLFPSLCLSLSHPLFVSLSAFYIVVVIVFLV